MKKVLSLVLALVMVLGSFSMVAAASYSDVTGTPVESAVDRLSLLGILEGYPDGSFKPEGQITRAEFAAVAVRAKGLEAVAQAAKGLPTGFKDVAATSWMSGYVGTAGKLGIVNGVGNGMFAPDAPVKYEEAVTMIVRALGYEAAAQSRGGYPYGYLIVANENGLLDAVKGTQGVAATRGLVAQLTDNALEIPMMVQVGFGSEVKWVVSGSKEHGGDEKYLLDEMGFDTYEGRVTSVNTKRNEITLDNEDADLKLKDKTVKVAKGFDFYEVEGLTIKAWYSNDTVILYTVKDEAKFDAVEYDAKEKEINLITEDELYEVARDAVLVLDGESVKADKFEADYAKVVLNDDDEIVWAEGFKLDGFILVDEVKDDKIIGYNDDELKIKDFTIVKEGKTILAADLEDGDVVFFNADEDFAVVSNNGKEGNLDRVYADGTFRFEGSAYSLSTLGTAMYFDEGKTGELVESILKDFLDDEVKVTVYVDFAGKVVLVSGEVNSVGNSAYAVITKDSTVYTGRKGDMVALDVRNGANEKVSYDIEAADLDDIAGITFNGAKYVKGTDDVGPNGSVFKLVNSLKTSVVVKLTVNKDGDLTKIEFPENVKTSKTFDISDANAKGTDGYSYKLQASTIVFYDSNKKATTLGNAKDAFKEVKEGATIYIEKGRVVAVVGDTDADADTKNVTGLVTGVKEVSGGKLQFTVKVFGVTERLLTESKTLNETTHKNLYEDKIATLVVGETSGEIKSFGTVKTNVQLFKIESISGRTITPVSGTAVELNNNAVIYDNGLDAINLRDLKPGMTITVYFQGSSNRFVDYVIAGTVNVTPGTAGVVNYINSDATRMIVKEGTVETTVVITNDTTIYTANKGILALGMAEVHTQRANILNKNVVEVKVVNGNLVSLRLQANFATLNNRIEAVELLDEAGYEAAGWTALQTALTAAKKVSANEVATQTEVDKANSDLATAQGALVAKNSDAKLSALTVSVGTLSPAFAVATTEYNVVLPYGTTVVPTTTATKNAATSTVVVKNAINVTGTPVQRTTEVTVTAEDGTVKVYSITFSVAPASSAKAITATTVGTLAGGNITDVPASTKVSALKAGLTVSADATVEILDGIGGAAVADQTATDVTATMVIKVTAQDGTTAEYTITME